MEKRRVMLIVGPSKSGKTRRALVEAERVGGGCVVAEWGQIASTGRLQTLLSCAPGAVIVEGVEPDDLVKAAPIIKSLCSRDTLFARKPYGRELFEVKCPLFIFTMMDLPVEVKEGSALFSRLEVIDMSNGEQA